MCTGTKKPQLRGFFANSLMFGVSAVKMCISRTQVNYITTFLSCVKIKIVGLFRAINKNSRLAKLPPPTADSILGCERINNVIIPTFLPSLTDFLVTNVLNRSIERW